MKPYLIILFTFLFSSSALAQTNAPSKIGSSSVNTDTKGKKLGTDATTQSLVQTMRHDTCLNKKFSLVFYVIQDSLGLPTSSTISTYITLTITPMVNALNSWFNRICVTFENCSTVVIPNYPFNIWDGAVEQVVVNNWYTENTINVYFPNRRIKNNPCGVEGAYAYNVDSLPASSRQRNIVVSFPGGDGALPHAMGHFFGLVHTFAEINPTLTVSNTPTNSAIQSREYVDGSNCSIHGDGICDTDADPLVIGSNSDPWHHVFAGYFGGVVDGKGDYYTPPVDNFMSFYWDYMCHYSQMQYNRMAYKIITKRLYLH